MKDGGPAFPKPAHETSIEVPSKYDHQECDGMSLRDYFAAHAPAEQEWSFEPTMPTKRPTPHLEENNSGDRVCVNQQEVDAWDRERRKQVAIQWPWVWADAMLAERGKRN